MALGIPAQFAPLLLSRALSRQLFVYAAFLLLTAEISLVAMGIHAQSWIVAYSVALLVIPGLALTVLMFYSQRAWVVVLFLLTAGGALFVVADAVLKNIPNAPTTALAPFALVSLAMTLGSGAADTVRGRVIWAVTGFVLSTVALWGASLVSRAEFRPDARSVIGGLVIIAIAFLVPGQVTVATKAQAAFDTSLVKIEEDDRRASVGREAVAHLHDTLLANLTVVTKVKPGPLPKELRSTLETELAHLVSTDWLVDAVENTEEERRNRNLASDASEAFLAVIDDHLTKGLTINVSGDISALGPLAPESLAALEGAVGQCLSNVAAHAKVLTVDVVVLTSGDAVTVTVIDGGIGFEPDAVDVDRLGLRVSVRSRIESAGGFVKIWSIPAQGTAIMLQLPYGENA